MVFEEDFFSMMRIGVDCNSKLYDKKSAIQNISVYDTKKFGKMLVLDGDIMLSEYDEFVYHEMIAHMPLNTHPNPKRVLIIGGGDGGTIREVLKHPSVEEIILCEIDSEVVSVSKEFFPTLSTGFNDKKVKTVFEDGFKFLSNYDNYFDLIITDSSEPIGPAVELFKENYFKLIKKALKKDGIMVSQSETPWLRGEIIKDMTRDIAKVFSKVETYTAFILLYPSGFWTFTFASDVHSLHNFNYEKSREIEKTCKYYNSEIHKASLALPNFLKNIVTNK